MRLVVFSFCSAFLFSAVAGSALAQTIGPGLHGIDRFTCHGISVEAGETRDQVLRKCGEPAWREVSEEPSLEGEVDSGYFLPHMREEWVYDFGHDQLLQFLRFRDDRLVTIRSGNYGFGGLRDGDCGYGTNLELGDSKLEVIAKCGEPTAGRGGEEEADESPTPVKRRRALMASDQWMYDFGHDRDVHYLIFRHGRLMEIMSGGYGRQEPSDRGSYSEKSGNRKKQNVKQAHRTSFIHP